ncbi:integral membrane protein [Prevotella sp. CAG:474]|jgi:drug/metabolite transporter (DMT)-like permease|uniref:DMT family transporter n=1 Tax=unclassified Prevotella TaxID=2638335 RepID=UPI000339D21B|nr:MULTISPECIES: DMT family transporter [unclassified Prevotella]OYP64715.1 EamA/RhaT family transporter [Prevotella sp. P5-108]OYP77303.1 EamA/RhaT family transporter [Prevotella sp. P4-67]CDD01291.1 integral membrane protein [Prevotella sp. CAG:474]
MARNNTWIYHLVAFATVAIWGCTFVSTKVLMLNGLSPAQIFTLRFLIAYVMMLAVYHSRLWADSWRDELKMMLLGISGGSLYFLSENEAMNFTSTTNTSLIVCSCPLFATLLVRLVYRSTTRISMMQLGGSLLAFAGMVIVVLNGRFVLHLSPLGDALAFTACLSWSVYSLLMKWVSAKYGAAFITRKVFFYGVLTILPYYIFYPTLPTAAVLTKPVVVGNLAFLGCLASMICFLTWNWCISKLGAVKATNWVYFNPITTMIFASWVLGEKITPYFLAGATCILLGMFVADRSTKTNN